MTDWSQMPDASPHTEHRIPRAFILHAEYHPQSSHAKIPERFSPPHSDIRIPHTSVRPNTTVSHCPLKSPNTQHQYTLRLASSQTSDMTRRVTPRKHREHKMHHAHARSSRQSNNESLTSKRTSETFYCRTNLDKANASKQSPSRIARRFNPPQRVTQFYKRHIRDFRRKRKRWSWSPCRPRRPSTRSATSNRAL